MRRQVYDETDFGVIFRDGGILRLYRGAYITEGEDGLNLVGNFIYFLDGMLDTARKRHLTGGILLSLSVLFGGLAVTVWTVGDEERSGDNNE